MKCIRSAAVLRSLALTGVLTVLTLTRAYCLWDTIVLPSNAPDCVRLAAADLQWYLGAVSTKKPRITIASSAYGAILLGTDAAASRLPGYRLPASPGDEGYAVRTHDGAIVCAGHTDIGTVYAVYALLRELGYFFSWGDDALPRTLPSHLPDFNIAHKPSFAVRGSLPWYNFFNSPTTWNPQDYRKFFDRQVRMGNNFIGFHVYDHEPFTPAPVDGKLLLAEPLHTTADPTWGTVPMQTSEFAFGTSRLFDQRYFGASAATRPGTREHKITRQQQMLAEALTYAHQRGLKTCLGFEVGGDPTEPSEQKLFLARLRHLLERYPMLDYVWLWQPEGAGLWGTSLGVPEAASLLGDHANLWQHEFRRVLRPTTDFPLKNVPGVYHQQNAKRLAEGARLALYARMAHDELQRHAAGVRLVVSGWGGDDRLLSADYYEGLDKLLPADVIFSSLDHIFPRDRVDRVYHDLPSDRERWPIVWFENDGDQWHPQPFVSNYEKIAADALAAGCQGMLGIHWRTRDVEENAGYLAAVSWQPGLSSDAFYEDWARRVYGRSLSLEMSSIHKELNAFGYRWIGGGGQMECGGFNWSPSPDPSARARLSDIITRLENLLADAAKAPDAPVGASERIRWLIQTAKWVLLFDKAVSLAASGNHDAQVLADAMRTYAGKVTSRGELGVLATINSKAWARFRSETSNNSPSWKPELPMDNLCKGPEPPDTALLARLPAHTEERRITPPRSTKVSSPKPDPKLTPAATHQRVTIAPSVTPGMVVLRWGPTPPGTRQWKVYLTNGGIEKLVASQKALALVQIGARILYPEGGPARFSIRAVNADAQESEVGVVDLADIPARSATGPSASWPPSDLASLAVDVKGVSAAPGGGAEFSGGGIEVPHSPAFDLVDQASILVDFRAQSTAGMPLLVSHGIFNVNGWFIQIFGGRIRFYANGIGLIDAGEILAGVDYRLAAVYTGSEMQIYLNGKLQGSVAVQGEPQLEPMPLMFGRYAHDEAHYYLKGSIRSVTIYPYALTAKEIASASEERNSR